MTVDIPHPEEFDQKFLQLNDMIWFVIQNEITLSQPGSSLFLDLLKNVHPQNHVVKPGNNRQTGSQHQ